MILTEKDFKGPLSLPTSTNIDVQYYIDYFEQAYAKKILGVELYNQLIIDPGNILIEKIWYPFELCSGLKDVLIHFIFYEYNKALQSQNTVVGNVTSKNENSESTGGYIVLKDVWNQAAKQAKLIQCFLKDHKHDENYSICQTVFQNTQFAQFKPYDTTITVGAVVIPARKYLFPTQVAAIISAYNTDINFQQSNQAIKLFSEKDLSGLEVKFNYNNGTADQEIVLTFGDFAEIENIYSKYCYSQIDYIIF